VVLPQPEWVPAMTIAGIMLESLGEEEK